MNLRQRDDQADFAREFIRKLMRRSVERCGITGELFEEASRCVDVFVEASFSVTPLAVLRKYGKTANERAALEGLAHGLASHTDIPPLAKMIDAVRTRVSELRDQYGEE